MSATLVGDLSEQAQKFWSPLTKDELKERSAIVSLLSREYDGIVKAGGDVGYVTQYVVGEATRKQVGNGHETFEPNKLSSNRIAIPANQVFSHSFEFDDLITMQTILDNPESELRMKMEAAVARKIAAYLFSLFSPSGSAPDHTTGSITDFNAAALLTNRTLAAQAHWGEDYRWIQLLSPSYYTDFLANTTVTSADYAPESPIVAGKFGLRRYGFEVYEDDSAGLLSTSTDAATTDVGMAFRQDVMHAILGQPQWKISDKHANNQFAYVMSLRVVGGAVAGHDHGKLCIATEN